MEANSLKFLGNKRAIIIIILIVIAMIITIKVINKKPPPPPTNEIGRREAIDFPICDGEDIWLTDKDSLVQVQLSMDCWSAKINLPPNRNFLIDVSEKLYGIRFWDGTVLNRADLIDFQKRKDGWFATIPYSSFRLRGIGEAKIIVRKKEEKK